MNPEQAQVGMKVKVRERQTLSEGRSTVGRVVGCYGGVEYMAVDVRFPDGHHRLFSPEDLEVEISSTRSWWRFLLRGR
jgi:hypothetical protein